MSETKGGYLIRNLGTRVEVCRPGEREPYGYVPTVPEALTLVDADRQPWPEERMDLIGHNGNEGLHYACQACGLCDPERGGLHVTGCPSRG